MTIKIIFDKERQNEQLCGGWGISYLIGESLLFDTGEKPEYVLANMKQLVLKEVKEEDLVELESYLVEFFDSPQLSPVVYSNGHWISDHSSDSELGEQISIFEYPYVRMIEED